MFCDFAAEESIFWAGDEMPSSTPSQKTKKEQPGDDAVDGCCGNDVNVKIDDVDIDIVLYFALDSIVWSCGWFFCG